MGQSNMLEMGKVAGDEDGSLEYAVRRKGLILKSAIGNRSQGWDLLPPGSLSYEFADPKDGKTYVYAGYGQSPLRWEKGTEPVPIAWKAGLQYEGDIARAQQVLSELATYYPGATECGDIHECR